MKVALCPIFLFFFLLLPSQLSAQEDSARDWRSYDAYQRIQKGKAPEKRDTGQLRYGHTPSLDSLIARYRRWNKEYPGIDGYRVQIYFGERKKAEDLKEDLNKEFPDIPAYLDYHAPNFRLRAGDFRTRIEAYRFLQELDSDYGNPYIVRTRIELPELSLP